MTALRAGGRLAAAASVGFTAALAVIFVVNVVPIWAFIIVERLRAGEWPDVGGSPPGILFLTFPLSVFLAAGVFVIVAILMYSKLSADDF